MFVLHSIKYSHGDKEVVAAIQRRYRLHVELQEGLTWIWRAGRESVTYIAETGYEFEDVGFWRWESWLGFYSIYHSTTMSLGMTGAWCDWKGLFSSRCCGVLTYRNNAITKSMVCPTRTPAPKSTGQSPITRLSIYYHLLISRNLTPQVNAHKYKSEDYNLYQQGSQTLEHASTDRNILSWKTKMSYSGLTKTLRFSDQSHWIFLWNYGTRMLSNRVIQISIYIYRADSNT